MKKRSAARSAFSCSVALLAFAFAASSRDARAAQTWSKYSANPVITEVGSFAPDIVVVGGTYHAFYTDRSSGVQLIRHRTSTDGITWGTSEVVLEAGASGAWDDGGVFIASVMYDGGFTMWYTGRSATISANSIGVATSADGTTWTKVAGNPVFVAGTAGSWDESYVREPSVVKVGATYHMWYAGTNAWPAFSIGHATSSDGLTWTRDPANPVLVPSPGAFDDATVYGPRVVHYGGAFHMWYSGGDGASDEVWEIGYASSCDLDGSTWTKDPDNPVLTLGTAPAWDCGDSVDYCTVLHDGTDWRMWYSGASAKCGGTDYKIGLATLTGTLPSPPSCTADLAVSKSVDNPAPLVGTNVVFTVGLSSAGPNGASDVVVTDALPTGLTWVSDDSGGTYDPLSGAWSISGLDAGASRQLHITARADAVGELTNTASITAAAPSDPNTANNTAHAVVTVAAPTPTPTPAPTPFAEIPTASARGLALFVLLLALAGVALLRRM